MPPRMPLRPTWPHKAKVRVYEGSFGAAVFLEMRTSAGDMVFRRADVERSMGHDWYVVRDDDRTVRLALTLPLAQLVEQIQLAFGDDCAHAAEQPS